MKKFVYLFMTLLLVFLMVSCNSSTPNISNETTSAIKRSIKIADKYLDYDMDYETAGKELDKIINSLKNLKNPTHDDESIKITIMSLDANILYDQIGDSEYDEILQLRNELADIIGEKTID